MLKASFELDSREVEEFIRPLPARPQLVYRLAVRGLCTEALVEQYRNELPALLKEAEKLSNELTEAVRR